MRWGVNGSQLSRMALEYVSPEGLRLDGRRPLELRQMRCHFGTVREAEGSVTFESGNTKILASVFGPRDAGRDRSEARTGRVVCHVSTAPFSSGGERRKRSRRDRMTRELGHIIREAFQANILTELFPKSRIDVFIHVLQADGGVLGASLNAAFLAVADAGIPMHDLCGAASLGVLNKTKLLDLNYLEEGGGGAVATAFVQRNRDEVLTLHVEKARFRGEELEDVVAHLVQGCRAAAEFLRGQLLERTHKLALAHGSS